MERKTATTFGELRQGDRFYFTSDSKKVVYQVTPENTLQKGSYNKVDEDGKKEWHFDKQASNDRQVIFLRHINLTQ
jgi:hypothetical protein